MLNMVKELLPKEVDFSEICFEGSEIVLYTKNEEFLADYYDVIKSIVDQVRKRIEVRADTSILQDQKETEKFIESIVPKEAELTEIYFEPEFSKVIIHTKRPGIAIGKSGENIRKIIKETHWTPEVKRSSAIDSEIVKSIRKMLHKNAGYRKKFLHQLGEKIYSPMKEVEWIRVTGLGGFREVGRSCILLKTPQSQVLLDCGISVSGSRPYPYLEVDEFNIQKIDAVILSHAHLDHCGLIPMLYKYGFRGPVYLTEPTRDLMALLAIDYIEVTQKEHKEPPYNIKDIETAIKHSVALDYGVVTDIAPDLRLTLENAGHMLGSSVVHLNIGNGLYNLLYTGDIKYGRTQMFEPARTNFTRVEGVIMESTYGSSEPMPSREEAEQKLIETVERVIGRGGKVLIPSFAAERGQEVAAILTNTNLDVKIYLDGMLWDATAIHTAYPEFMSKEMQRKILKLGKNPFLDPRLKSVGSQKEREKVLSESSPSVIISTSGMLNGGPILEYLEKMAENEGNALVFVGYQAEGSLGRRIQKGWKHVVINDKTVDINLEVVTIEGLSGHSPQKELISYIGHLKTKPKKILICHGEPSRARELARTLHKTFKVETYAPMILETIRFR
ncbi:MAG: beta-CASP ribonuclease aCPSF1 [Candidatus Aenigmarchaeota archaeon]|nr:beta-CASP ribonuclease aCPSF1 [Candidatus Aenigmarchaeota archaeon]